MNKKSMLYIAIIILGIIAGVYTTLELLFPENYRVDTFTTNGFNVRTLTMIDEDFCVIAVYWKDKPLTNEEITLVLEENNGGSKWIETKDEKRTKRWAREDARVGAVYRKETSQLGLITKQFYD